MHIVVIAGFIVAMSLMGLPVPDAAGPWWAVVAGVVCYVALTYAMARGSASLGLRRLMRGNGDLGRWPMALTAAVQIYLIVGLGVLLTAGGVNLIVRTLGLEYVPLLGKVLAVAPFIAALLAYWLAMYPLDRALRQRNSQVMAMSGGTSPPVWTRGQFLGFNIRHNLLFLAVPVGLIVLVLDVLYLAEPVLGQTVAVTGGLFALGAIFVSAPAIIVRIWRTSPLPAGPLRSRLEQMSRQAGFTCRNILVWNTGGMIVNAAVLGATRPVRYVLLSDAMLEHFDENAVAAIFAHEAGHVVHRHITYMVLFSMGLILLIGSVAELSAARMDISSPVAELLAMSATGVLWLWLFGMLSRRFERQADVFAAATAAGDANAELTAEGVTRFNDALLKVGRLNGISPSRKNFRHGSISHRLEYLKELLRSGADRSVVDRGVRRVKLAIWLLAAISVGVTIVSKM